MPVNILVVDDEPDLLTALNRALSDEGYEVATAFNGQQALAAIEQTPPALILTDVMMPGIDGYELLRLLRSRGDATPVVLMSAGLDPFIDFDNVRCVRKPFDLDHLIAVIDELLSAGDR